MDLYEHYERIHQCHISGYRHEAERQEIELLQQVYTRHEMGISTTTLERMGTVLAYFCHLSRKEVFAAATVNYKKEVLFQVNYRTVLTNITRINTFEGYEED